MSHSYSYCLFHCAWSTQQRQNPFRLTQAGCVVCGRVARQNGFAIVVSAAHRIMYTPFYPCLPRCR